MTSTPPASTPSASSPPARTPSGRAAPRRLVHAAVLAAGLAVLLVASPAAADVPVGWSDPDEVSGLDYLWIFVGAPAALFIVVAVLAWLPGLISGERVGAGAEAEDTWFGGPTTEPAALGAGPTSDEEADTGGASARW